MGGGVHLGYSPEKSLDKRGKGCKFALMKAKVLIIASLVSLATVLTPGCGRRSSNELKFWTPVEKVSDSLMAAIDREYNDSMRVEIIVPLIGQLDSVAKVVNNDMVTARALMWKSQLENDDSVRNAMYEKAMSLIDGDKYPYEMARIRHFYIRSECNDSETRYMESRRILSAFEAVKDSAWITAAHVTMANAMGDLGLWEMSLRESKEALRYCIKKDDSDAIKINLATTYEILGNKEEALSLADSLINNLDSMSVGVMSVVGLFHTRYFLTGDIDDALMAYRIMDNRKDLWTIKHSNEMSEVTASIVDYHLKENRIDSVMYYADIMRRFYKPQLHHTMDLILADAKVYELQGIRDSFDVRMDEYRIAKLAEARKKRTARIASDNMKVKIQELDAEMDREKREAACKFWVTIAGVVIALGGVAAGVILVVKRRHRREREELEKSLDRNRRRLTVAEMKVVEKEKALEDVMRQVSANDNDRLDAMSKKLLAQIKSSQGGDLDWEKLNLLFCELHPDFMTKLKEAAPTLSSGDMRLAALIYMGVETKHIARLMSINADSVKKNRQRLRSKLKLTPDQSVDDFLRQLMR